MPSCLRLRPLPLHPRRALSLSLCPPCSLSLSASCAHCEPKSPKKLSGIQTDRTRSSSPGSGAAATPSATSPASASRSSRSPASRSGPCSARRRRSRVTRFFGRENGFWRRGRERERGRSDGERELSSAPFSFFPLISSCPLFLRTSIFQTGHCFTSPVFSFHFFCVCNQRFPPFLKKNSRFSCFLFHTSFVVGEVFRRRRRPNGLHVFRRGDCCSLLIRINSARSESLHDTR